MADLIRQRAVLDANKGITNVLESDTIRTDLRRVYDKIFDTLAAHYGPFSKFAVIMDNNDYFADPVFTKDGINIVRAIEFVSPMEDWAKKTIAYIGDKIEGAAGDGTTSAMMFSCAMLTAIHNNVPEEVLNKVSFDELKEAWSYIVDCANKYINEHTYTWQSLMENNKLTRYKAVYQIAYAQSYCSTHGNHELSSAVANLFASTPPEAWRYTTFQRKTYESEELFSVKCTEGQFELACEPIVKSVYNMGMGSWLEYKDATLFILNDAIRYEGPALDKLKQILGKTTTEPVLLICHANIDNETYNWLITEIRAFQAADKHFAVFTCKVDHPAMNDITMLRAVAGDDPSDKLKYDMTVVEHAYLKYTNNTLVIDGLYPEATGEADSEGTIIYEHPYIKDVKYDYFEHMLSLLEEMQSGFDKLTMTPTEKKQQSNYRRLYNKLRFSKQKTLVIGGNTYDNLALFDVVEDAMAAVSTALREGVVAGNNRSIYNMVDSWSFVDNVAKEESYPLKCRRYLFKALKEAMSRIALIAFSHIRDIDNRVDEDGILFARHLKSDAKKVDYWMHHTIDFMKGKPIETINLFNTDTDTANDNIGALPIVQPANVDIALLKRFGEVALKFILTERIIMRGGAYLGDKKNESRH